MFFEHLGSAKVYSGRFKLVSLMNISVYARKYELIKKFQQKTISLCRNHSAFQIDIVSCQKTLKLLEVEIPTITQKRSDLYSLLNHKREKRGIFNGGGTMLKWVLGIADNDDLDEIHDAIRHVEDDDKSVLNLMKQQIHVIRSTIGNFNDSIESLKVHEATLNEDIAQLNEFLNTDGVYKRKNDLSIRLLSYLNAITYMVSELNEQLDILIDAILFAKSNVIHPKMIAPLTFIEELNKQSRSLRDGKTFPLPLEPHYAFKMLEISRVLCSYSDERLIFIIETPICDPTVFNTYRSLPLPVIVTKSESYLYLEPTFPFLLLSQNKMQYKQLKDLNECVTITDDDILCESHTIYSTLEHPTCETTLLTSPSRQTPSICKTTTLRGNVYIWHELKFNQWVYVLTEPDRLTIICDQQTHDQSIQGTGILTLDEKCIAYSRLNKLIPKYKLTSEYVNVIPDVPIAINCCEEKSNDTKSAIHLHEINLSGIRLDELRHTTHQLNKFEKDINYLKNQHYTYSKHTNYFYLGLQITLGIIILVIIYKVLRCTGCFAIMAACCKCFDFNNSSSRRNGCCVSIYNQCANTVTEQPRLQEHTIRMSDLQRVDSQTLYDVPYNTPQRQTQTHNDPRKTRARKSYHGYSLDD